MTTSPANLTALRLGTGVLLLGALLECLAYAYGFPHLDDIGKGVASSWREGVLSHDVQVSLARWAIGWAVGAAFGIALGVATGRSQTASLCLEGLLMLLRAVPFITLVPLSLRIFGLSESGKVFLVAWATASICWVVMHQTAKGIDPQMLWRAKSLGCSRLRSLFRLVLPSCGRGILTALRTSLAIALIVVAVAEMSGVYERSSGYWWSEGLGYRLFRSYEEGRDDLMLGAILVFALLGIALEQLLLGTCRAFAGLGAALRKRLVLADIAHLPSPGNESPQCWQDPVPMSVTGLCASYNGNAVLDDLSLDLRSGETRCLVGPSGCGKTTLIKALGCCSEESLHTSGVVAVDGEELRVAGPWLGLVLQDAPVFEHLTVWGNVCFGNRVRSVQTKRAALWLLREFGLADDVAKRAHTLSGGQRQRLALATALANQPSVLLLDEPFGALDAITRRTLQEYYWKYTHGRVTAIFVTHDIGEALLISDRVQVGVKEGAKIIDVAKGQVQPHKWELGTEYGELRVSLLSALADTEEEPQVNSALPAGSSPAQTSQGRGESHFPSEPTAGFSSCNSPASRPNPDA